MTLGSGERQVAPDLSGIRRDHLARYEWAAKQLPPGSRVLDLACGIGYGAAILADAGHKVVAVDRNGEAIAYAREHYDRANVRHLVVDAEELQLQSDFDAVVCFETIEHLRDPRPLLAQFASHAKMLLASVPNEACFPYTGQKFHFRHYTRAQFADLLVQTGWLPERWRGQQGPQSHVGPDPDGRTLITMARPSGVAVQLPPAHVAIIGLGPSMAVFHELAKRLGGRSAYCDEVWAINAAGNVLDCDRVFHMDDVLIQEERAALNPGGNIAAMVRWLKTHKGPVYTSIPRPGYPGMVPFPLEAVLNSEQGDNGGAPYFNSTAAYAIALAVHERVQRISLFGLDYTHANAHQAEQGRACCEFWLGIAAARGIEITIPEQSTLMDACAPERERLYGYDCADVSLHDRDDGGVAVRFAERADRPTGAEIENRYDHKHHPNRLVRQAKEQADASEGDKGIHRAA